MKDLNQKALQNNNKKICIVTSSLGKGGAERSAAQLSVMLHQLHYEVHIVTVLNVIEYQYGGTLFNLGALKDKKDTTLGRLQRLKLFKAYLNQHKFDVIIDGRSRVQAYREFLISKWIYKEIPVVYVIHSYNLSKVFTPYKFLNKYLYSNARMLAVSEEARQYFKETFQLNNIEVIYNAFDFEAIANQAEDLKVTDSDPENYIVFYGRIHDESKNLKLLLEAYKESKLPEEHVALMLIGSGPDEAEIKNYVLQLKLQNHVVFKGFLKNPYPYVKHARFGVLTSRFEGFPMVIPETLSLGVPVISVDCQSGPREVITNAFNGLLVENFNSEALAEAMNSFIFNASLYQTCQSNAAQSVARFSVKNIANHWKQQLDKI